MKNNQHQIIRFGSFEFNTSNMLGNGATGDVFRGYRLTDGASFAIKVVNMKRVNNQVLYYLHQSQKKAMKILKHPNIIRTQQIDQQKDWCYFVMEECRGGTLKDFIEKKGKLDCQTALLLFKQILNGYIAVLEAHILHRDIKPANIMLRNQKQPVIIDFGFCELILSKRPLASYNVGSPSYMSPQAYLKSLYSQKSDVWGLGATLYEMVTGKTLDDGLQSKIFFDEMVRKNCVSYNTHGLSGVVKRLLEECFKISPQDRASCHRLKYIIDKSMLSKINPVRYIQNDIKTPLSAGYKSSYYLPFTKKKSEDTVFTPLRSKPILLQLPENANTTKRKISISINQKDQRQIFANGINFDGIIEKEDSYQIPSRRQDKVSLNDLCSFQTRDSYFNQQSERKVLRTCYQINQPKFHNENSYKKTTAECREQVYYQKYHQKNSKLQKIDEYYKENHQPYQKRFVTQTTGYVRPSTGVLRNLKPIL